MKNPPLNTTFNLAQRIYLIYPHLATAAPHRTATTANDGDEETVERYRWVIDANLGTRLIEIAHLRSVQATRSVRRTG